MSYAIPRARLCDKDLQCVARTCTQAIFPQLGTVGMASDLRLSKVELAIDRRFAGVLLFPMAGDE